MLDLGWAEILIIAVAALIVVGPKDLPRMLRTLGQYAARAKSVAREFQRSMDDAARQADLDDLRDVKKDLDKDVAGVRDAQYKMQREMSQSFLDEGRKPKTTGEETGEGKADTGKPETGKASSGKTSAGTTSSAKPEAGKASAGKASAGKTSAGKRAADKPGNGGGTAAGKGGAARADDAPGKAPASAPPDPPAADEPARKPSAGKVGGA